MGKSKFHTKRQDLFLYYTSVGRLLYVWFQVIPSYSTKVLSTSLNALLYCIYDGYASFIWEMLPGDWHSNPRVKTARWVI